MGLSAAYRLSKEPPASLVNTRGETVAVTLTDMPRPAELEPPYEPLGHARHAADWLTEEQVAADQRRRLYGAMIDLVAKHGYAAVSTDELARLARTSKRDMYKRFGSKENYFLATYDMIVARAIDRVSTAYAGEESWKQQLRHAFEALVAEVVEQPKAARLALSEVLGAGPAGRARIEGTRSLFEAIVGASFAESPDAPALPPIIVKGIVRGVERIIRQRLLSGREHELPALSRELLDWALSYHSPAVSQLAAARPADTTRGVLRLSTSDERARVLRVAAQIAARSGYRHLTPAHIANDADIPVQRVQELCGDDPGRCFLDALELLSTEALICAGQASRRSQDRPVGVHLGIAALVDRVARDHALCQLAFVEIFELGPSAFPHREALLAKFKQALVATMPKNRRPTPLAAEASIGAIWGILHHHVTHAQTRLLPGLAGHISYLALAPAIGADDAIRAILHPRQALPARHAPAPDAGSDAAPHDPAREPRLVV